MVKLENYNIMVCENLFLNIIFYDKCYNIVFCWVVYFLKDILSEYIKLFIDLDMDVYES